MTIRYDFVEFHPSVAQVPGASLARDGKALSFSNDQVLILHHKGNEESAFFDMSEERIVQRRVIPFSKGRLDHVEVVDSRYLLFFGKDAGFRGAHAYDLKNKKGLSGRNISLPKSSQGITLLQNPRQKRIYIFGGKKRIKDFKNFGAEKAFEDFKYFDKRYGWIAKPSMMIGRAYAAAAVVNNNDFVVTGGYSFDPQSGQYKETSSTEIFNGTAWYQGPSLNIARQNHSTVVIGDSNNIVVVLGGKTSRDEPIEEIEIWDMTTNNGFVVLPSSVLPSGRRPSTKLNAIAHQGCNIYLIGGYGTDIDKITFDLEKLRLFTSGAGQAASMPAVPTASPQNEDDRKKPAKVAKHVAQAPVGLQTIGQQGGETTWLPTPPTLPRPPTAFSTLLDRNNAMSDYIANLEVIQGNYQVAIEASTGNIVDYYKQLCDKEIDLVRFHGRAWLSRTEGLIQQAKNVIQLQEATMLSLSTTTKRTTSITSFLRQVDKDEYYDDIPSQLRCPLTLDIMTDPVVAADGNTYERSALEAWFLNSRQQATNKNKKYVPRSPLTGAELKGEDFVSVHTLRSMCEEFSKRMEANFGRSSSTSRTP